MVQLNRLQSNKLCSMTAANMYDKSQRRARTRTLIQVGGLVDIAGLLDYCNIQLGVDLQLEEQDKAATLLGILVEIIRSLPTSMEQQTKWRDLGIRVMKEREAKKYYSK